MLSRALAVSLVLVSFSARAFAQQFVLVDKTYTHSADNTVNSHYRVGPSKATPSNWTTPVDYRLGRVYGHIEVFTKPSAEPTRFSICSEGTSGYGCTHSPTYTRTGVLDWSIAFSQLSNFAKVDWSIRPYDVALILEDSKGVRPSPQTVGAARSALFMPTMVRIVVTIVAAGATYMPPAATNPDAGAANPAVDGGAKLDAGVKPDGAARGTDAAEPTPADADAGAGGGGGAGGGTPTKTTTTTPPPAEPDPDTAPPDQPPRATSGCAVGGGAASPGAAPWLLLVLAALSVRAGRAGPSRGARPPAGGRRARRERRPPAPR